MYRRDVGENHLAADCRNVFTKSRDVKRCSKRCKEHRYGKARQLLIVEAPARSWADQGKTKTRAREETAERILLLGWCTGNARLLQISCRGMVTSTQSCMHCNLKRVERGDSEYLTARWVCTECRCFKHASTDDCTTGF